MQRFQRRLDEKVVVIGRAVLAMDGEDVCAVTERVAEGGHVVGNEVLGRPVAAVGSRRGVPSVVGCRRTRPGPERSKRMSVVISGMAESIVNTT